MALTRPRAALLLLIAVLLHDGEEAVTYAATRGAAARLVAQAWPGFEAPTPAAFQAVAVGLSLALGAALLWAGFTRRERSGWLVVKATAAVFLANVILPHVPAAVLLGGYAPGVVTAVAINLPLTLWILLRGGRPAA